MSTAKFQRERVILAIQNVLAAKTQTAPWEVDRLKTLLKMARCCNAHKITLTVEDFALIEHHF